MSSQTDNIFGLDIGSKRIGLARVNLLAKIPEPLAVLANDDNFLQKLALLANEHSVKKLVVGLPRNLNGQETSQTEYTRQFVNNNLTDKYEIIWQDETLSSVEADKYLKNTGINQEAMLDAIAACIILEDYINS
jgi:putative Holliday junction resolvase